MGARIPSGSSTPIRLPRRAAAGVEEVAIPRLPTAGGGAAGAAGRGGGRAGGRVRGERGLVGVNSDPDLQPDSRVRELDAQASTPGPREEVYCTKIGTTHPEEMYIVGAHMDGIGFGEAANDDGSGTALVMEVARILSSPRSPPSARFVSHCGITRRPA